MVVKHDIHLFASHKGGTGKTLLCFQTATQYAARHPEENVIVFDLTELGDLTKRMFGHSPEAIERECGAIFDLFNAVDSNKKASEGVMSSFASLLGKSSEKIIPFANSVRPGLAGNPSIPENIYLVSSGAQTTDSPSFDYNKYAEAIRSSLENDENPWKVFIDTDGDRRPSPFTKLGYCVADLIVVPLEPDFADFNRLEQMITTVDALKDTLNFHSKISTVIWNKIQLTKSAASNTGSFTTTKVSDELIDVLNEKLYDQARKYPGMFLHSGSPSLEEFVTATVCRVRDFSNTVALPSNAEGVPFCKLTAGPVKSGNIKFSIGADQISGAVENIEDLLGRLESMIQ